MKIFVNGLEANDLLVNLTQEKIVNQVKQDFEAFKNEFKDFEVVSDSGWKGTTPYGADRGYTVYTRKVVFGTILDAGDLEEVRLWLTDNNCPGWTGVTKDYKDDTWIFTTADDSTD